MPSNLGCALEEGADCDLDCSSHRGPGSVCVPACPFGGDGGSCSAGCAGPDLDSSAIRSACSGSGSAPCCGSDCGLDHCGPSSICVSVCCSGTDSSCDAGLAGSAGSHLDSSKLNFTIIFRPLSSNTWP